MNCGFPEPFQQSLGDTSLTTLTRGRMTSWKNPPQITIVLNGQLEHDGSWLYVWMESKRRAVAYVGGTGIDPTLRTWLHLNDHDPAIGRIRALLPSLEDTGFEVLAFPLPVEISRPGAKRGFIARLNAAGLLGPAYLGQAPETASIPESMETGRLLDGFVEQVLSRTTCGEPGTKA